jgi:hypothetical protein
MRAACHAERVGGVASMCMYQDYAIRIYLLYVVDTIIFSSKAKNYIYLTYLLYLRDIELINVYAWGPVALSFLYRELSASI